MVTIKSNKDFKKVYNYGKYFFDPLLITYKFKNRLKINRIGITATKKVGNAVKRNRSKRIIKAAYFQIFKELPIGFDFIFIVRELTYKSNTNALVNIMHKQMKKLL